MGVMGLMVVVFFASAFSLRFASTSLLLSFRWCVCGGKHFKLGQVGRVVAASVVRSVRVWCVGMRYGKQLLMESDRNVENVPRGWL
uniref:Putative secreted protein n=1 Tax=Anopheles darlingi TaxID=43151 RepID=A0A2M4DM26_ANODA